MSKGNIITGIVFLVLGVVVTYSVAMFGFVTENVNISNGFPFEFTSFNFLGSETNQTMLVIDVIFWSIILYGIWKIILKVIKK